MMSIHLHTPQLSVIDPRALVVRSIMYCRSVDADGSVADERVNRVEYDAAGRAEAQWDPRLWALKSHDAQAPANLKTIYSLSAVPVLSLSVDAGERITLCGDAGQILHTWDGRGSHRLTEHDTLLRPLTVHEQACGVPLQCIERYGYGTAEQGFADHNQCGQLIRHDDPAGTLHLREFGLNSELLAQTRHFLQALEPPDWPQSESERDRLLETGAGYSTLSRFNALGVVLRQTDAKGNQQQFEYTVDGQLSEVRLLLADASSPKPVVSNIHYNSLGQIESQTAGNGLVSEVEFDPADGRLLRMCVRRDARSPLQNLSYHYDSVGNVLRIEDHTQAVSYFSNQRVDGINDYVYDSLYQLIEATGREAVGANIGRQLSGLSLIPGDTSQLLNYTECYQYDAGGNLIELRHIAANNNYTRTLCVAPDSNRALLLAEGQSPSNFTNDFDDNGNLLALQTGHPLHWDTLNQLSRVTLVARADAEDDTERYVYDGSGQRVRKVQLSQAKAVTHTAEVRYLPGLEVRTRDGECLSVITLNAGRCDVRCLHWFDGQPSSIENDQWRYSLSDQLGSSTMELDSEAHILTDEGYYPFGGTAWWVVRSELEASYKVIRYSGKERDVSGLYYYGFRYYAPWIQRWINPDPSGSVDGLNRYAMVKNNPLTLRDKNGLTGFDFNFIVYTGSDVSAKSYAGNLFDKPKNRGRSALYHWNPRHESGSEAGSSALTLMAGEEHHGYVLGARTRLYLVMHGMYSPGSTAFYQFPPNLRFNFVDYDSQHAVVGFHGGVGDLSYLAGQRIAPFFDALKRTKLLSALGYEKGKTKDLGRISIVACNVIDPGNYSEMNTPYYGFAQLLHERLSGVARVEVTARFGEVSVVHGWKDINKKVMQSWANPNPVGVKLLGTSGKHVFKAKELQTSATPVRVPAPAPLMRRRSSSTEAMDWN